MANPRFAWGIDIGNRALKAIKLVRDGDTLRMDDVEVIEHEQVLSNSGDNRETLIQTALANFAQRHEVKGGVVSVGVSGQSSFARFIKLPPVEEKKIPEIVKFEAIQQIPFPLDQVEWSYQLFRQADSPDVEVGIFAMRKELVNQQIKYFTDLDMNVQVVQMSPLAVYNAMYYDNRLADGTTMILDLGAENADLIIAEGESVWLRSVPIGGNNFTEALVKAFKLNFAKAEELKRNAQTSKYARQIFQAMRPIFADLVAEVQRSIGFYSSVHRDSRIKRIVALGNTFRLPTLQKYLQQNLQIDVERLDSFHAGTPDDGRQAAVLSDNIGSMAGAYGLALQAMGQGKIGSSLLPVEIKRAKIWKEKTKLFATAAAICVAAVGVKYGMYAYHEARFDANASLQQRIDGTVREAESLDGKWAAIESSGEPDKIRIRNVSALQTYRDTWTNIWADIAKSLPAQNGQDPAKLKSIPRRDRQQIFIDSINSVYSASMGPLIKAGDEQFKTLAQPSAGGNGNLQVGGGGYGGAGGYGGSSSYGGYGGGRGPEMPRFTPPMPGVGGMPGGFRPGPSGVMPGMPSPDGMTPGTETGPVERGYLITLQVTSPNRQAPTLVDAALVRDLMQRVSLTNALKEGKNYYVARAMVVSALPISSDESRKAKLRQDYEQKRAAQEAALQNPNGTPGGGGYDAPAAIRGRMPYQGRGTVGRSMDPRSRLTRPGGGEDLTTLTEADKEAFTDPLYKDQGEMVLDDWQLTVLIAVVLDTAAPPVDPNAPAATPTPTPETASGTEAAPAAIPVAAPADVPGQPAPAVPTAPASEVPPQNGAAVPASATQAPRPDAASTGAPR
jgi:type IV pilus assembly protein PilM